MHERLIVNLDIQGNRIEEDKNDNPNGVYKGHGKENLNENPTSSYSGEHTHIVEGGDPETRPVNIALYLVIRVK